MVAAIDIGASGGRVISGIVSKDRIDTDDVHRFPNGVVTGSDGRLHWNASGLFEQVLDGLRLLAEKYPEVSSIGIDTWAVDYGLIDRDGRLIAEPVSYRDPRTAAVIDSVHRTVSPAELFSINGLQYLPFTTIYQLVAEQRGPTLQHAAHALLLPDLIAFWLTGVLRTEYTNATTTGLVDVHTRDWSTVLLERLGISDGLLPPIEQPGAHRGVLLPTIAARTGLPPTIPVTTVASHDTASAVVGVPATTPATAFVASGTWSLVGVETAGPVLHQAARIANFTNEGGADGTYRFLRNVGGLWYLQESMRTWAEQGRPQDLAALIDAAANEPDDVNLFDVDADALIPPDGMPERIADQIVASGGQPPSTPAALTRSIIDSLAHGYARTVRDAGKLTERPVETIHMVGGGSQNALLCQRTADLSRKTVIAGPVEATAIGNVLVQARALGAAPTSLHELRELVASSTTLRRSEPC
ncbi:MAG: rhamnulokinase family protein [Chloroflexota bacterium]